MERPARAPPARAPPLPPCPIHRISNTRAQACLEQSIRKASNVPRKVAHLVRTAATGRSTPWPRRRRGGGRTAGAGTEAKRLAAGTLGWMEEKVRKGMRDWGRELTVGEDIAAAASLEAAARAMAAEVGGGTLLCSRHEGEWGLVA